MQRKWKSIFFKTGLSNDSSKNFGYSLEVNRNIDILKSLHVCGGKALVYNQIINY